MCAKYLCHKALITAAAAIILALVGPRALTAQPIDADTPVDSVLWWTLTDDISPTELKSRYWDPKDHRRRYLQAVALGKAEPITDEALSRLIWYQNGYLWPELVPLFAGFGALADRLYHPLRDPPRWTDAYALGELRRYGIGAEGSQRILDSLHELHALTHDYMDATREDVRRFVALMRRTKEVTQQNPYRELRASPVALDKVIRATGVDRAEAERYYRAWKFSPGEEAAKAILPGLKEDLSTADWQRLRDYLREEVVNFFSAVEFLEPPSGSGGRQ